MDWISADAVRQLLLFAPAFILSLSFHEFCHAWVADKLGDSTARYLGRLTMDPMAHISWLGTVIIPAFAVLTGAPLFGWANPVPVDQRNFRDPRKHMAFVAMAGPVSNLFLATLCTALLSLIVHKSGSALFVRNTGGGMASAAVEMLVMAVQLNLFLAFFNLIPIPPLDGWQIFQGLVNRKTAEMTASFASYGNWILLILFFTGFLKILAIPVYAFMGVLFGLFQLS